MNKSLCRIGVFYDGSYFSYAQRYFYASRKVGWLVYTPFHALIENHVREKEQGYASYRVVYAAWFQGLFTASQSSEKQRRVDRNRDLDLMHSGIEPRYVPMSQSGTEKGIDVALAVDAMQVGLQGMIDIAALVAGDGDFVPLVRALMKHGVPVTAVYFDFKDARDKSFINDRLLSACNYSLNVNSLERDRKYQSLFRGLFRSAKPTPNAAKEV